MTLEPNLSVSLEPNSSTSLKPNSTKISAAKIRKYNSDYLKMGFTFTGPEQQPKPQCVICYESISNKCMKPAKLRRHLETKHPEYKRCNMKVLYILAILLLVTATVKTSLSDCLSAAHPGPCEVWDNETCRRVCKGEGRISGHCSSSLKCWCEGC
ncbi:uncharacterized protein [Diabrotica undecimpunctata]|uniref:uncharacterized protein n=1 Tax=Diabrotica undecimpunctata TaxID=50387 RepID=UPI003B642AB3